MSNVVDLSERQAADAAEKGKRPSQAKQLLELALAAKPELFHTRAKEAYATVVVDRRRETLPIDSPAFKRWLGWLVHQTGDIASGSAISDVKAALESRAIYDGAEHEVHIRVAGSLDAKIYIDLGDSTGKAIEVRPDGWTVVDEPPVKFRRPGSLMPLPVPVPGGTVDDLRLFLNVPDERWPLLIAWAVVALMPSAGFPVLVLHGEHGTAKSTTAKLIRSLVDPARPELRGEPDNVNNLMLAARNSWVLAFDNLSKISQQYSDAFSRIATGGGHAVREHYSNYDEALFDACRPIIITGIDAVPTRGDLLSRTLLVQLQRIPTTSRQTESALWTSFEQMRPRILGALLDGVAAALANRKTTELDELPRMAEFMELATAAESGIGLAPGAVQAADARNRGDATLVELDSSALWPAIEKAADGIPREALELLRHVEALAPEAATKKGWPQQANTFSRNLTRLQPALSDIGIEVVRGSHGRGPDRRDTITLQRSSDGGGNTGNIGNTPGIQGISPADGSPPPSATGRQHVDPSIERGRSLSIVADESNHQERSVFGDVADVADVADPSLLSDLREEGEA
jgi:hypothetical protein